MTNTIMTAIAFLIFAQVGYAEESSLIPKATFVYQKDTDIKSSGRFQINLIAGCYGDREAARKNILHSAGILKDPYFSETKYSPSIFAFQEKSPTCVIGNNTRKAATYKGDVLSLERHVSEHFYDCQCGTCDDGEHSFPE